MNSPTFAISVTFEIHAEFIAAFRNRIRQQAEDSIRREPGCLQFDVLEDESNPGIIVLYETYADATAFDAHKRTEHFEDYDRTVAPWIANKNVRRLRTLSTNRKA